MVAGDRGDDVLMEGKTGLFWMTVGHNIYTIIAIEKYLTPSKRERESERLGRIKYVIES